MRLKKARLLRKRTGAVGTASSLSTESSRRLRRRGLMLTNKIVAGLLALALIATAAPARAGSGAEEIFVPAVAAVLLLTFDIVNIAYIAQGPSRSAGREAFAVLGILLGTAVGLCTAIEVDWGDITGLEMAGFTLCAATVALGVGSLLLDYDEDPRAWMIAPSVLADSGGRAVPAALLGGTF